jgi:hypothetical protein
MGTRWAKAATLKPADTDMGKYKREKGKKGECSPSGIVFFLGFKKKETRKRKKLS